MEPTYQWKGINLEAILSLLVVLAITVCACFGMVVVWFPSAGALQYLYEALISEKDDKCKPYWKEWLVKENFSERWEVANVEDLEWDERLLVHNKISEGVKLEYWREKRLWCRTRWLRKIRRSSRTKRTQRNRRIC